MSKDNLDLNKLKNKAIKGGVLTVTAKFITILVQISSILILSRMLSPTDFGLIAMVTAITAFMGIFRDMGLSTAAIQKKDLKLEQINMLFWLNILLGLFLTLITCLCSGLIADFYKRPELQLVIALLSTVFIISSIGAQHSALLQRELNLKPKILGDVLGALTTLSVSIALAYYGFGFWSLAWGTVLGALVTTLLYFIGSSFTPKKPKIVEGVRELLSFGANVTIFEILNYFHRNLDNILIGRVWGALTLGLYSRAYQLMMLPIGSLRDPINAIAFPVLSQLQNNHEEFKKYYKNIASILAILSMPLMAFLIVNANNVIKIALGEGWNDVVPIFIILGISGFIQAVASLRGLVLLSLGQSRKYALWGVVNSICVSIGFVIGVKWGAKGVAISYAVVNYVLLYPSLWYFFKNTPLKPIDFFIPITGPAISSILAAIISYVVMSQVIFNYLILHILFSGILFLIIFLSSIALFPNGMNTLRLSKKLIGRARNDG